MKRVVVTGMSAITALGHDWHSFKQKLQQKQNAVMIMPGWELFTDMNTRLAAPVLDFQTPAHFGRKQTRSMGRVAIMGTACTEQALMDAGLLNDPVISNGDTGIAYGSSIGSTDQFPALGRMKESGDMSGINSATYLKMMAQTTPVNIGLFFGVKGRVIPTSSACTSSSQGIGYAYEAIKYGHQKVMIAGGAEELCVTEAVVFDTLYATSTKNNQPKLTPRPFDRDRDGLVIGEGAGTFILEEYEHAVARGARIYAEVLGFGTNCDGNHVTQPTADTMQRAMEIALAQTGLHGSDIGYVNAHGTATTTGDIAESRATEQAIGNQVLFSSLKSYLGHTLGACGAVEAWATIQMMNEEEFFPTINLDNIDPECGELDYIMGDSMHKSTEFVMSNNFAFGGINTSLIFQRWS